MNKPAYYNLFPELESIKQARVLCQEVEDADGAYTEAHKDLIATMKEAGPDGEMAIERASSACAVAFTLSEQASRRYLGERAV